MVRLGWSPIKIRFPVVFTLHKKWNFSSRIFSVNVTKSAVSSTRLWSHLQKKSSMENFIFCAVLSQHFKEKKIHRFHQQKALQGSHILNIFPNYECRTIFGKFNKLNVLYSKCKLIKEQLGREVKVFIVNQGSFMKFYKLPHYNGLFWKSTILQYDKQNVTEEVFHI